MQMVQEADSVQQDYSVWQMPPQLDENGRQIAAIFGPAPSPAETPAASHAITEDIAADPTHLGMRTSYMEGAAGPDHESHLAQCMDHLRTHWPAIIPFLENYEQYSSLAPPPEEAPVAQEQPIQHTDRGTPSAAQGLAGVRIGEAANPGARPGP